MVAILAFVAVGFGLWVRTASKRKRQQYQAVLNERSRLARELHDTLEQGLAGIALQLEAVSGSFDASPQAARRSLDVALHMLRYSQEEARRSVMDLRSQALESRDLAGALSDLAHQMTLGTAAVAEVEVEGTVRRLDASEEHHLLRIGLEALTNALKHSGARHITLKLRFAPDATELIVQDDGCGLVQRSAGETTISPGGFRLQAEGDGHFGLMGIRERVDKLGGVLHITGAPGGGMQLSITVPSRKGRTFDRIAPIVGESWRTS
jgi:signal transduction histidine kinase